MTITVLGGGISEKGELPEQVKIRLRKVKEMFEEENRKPNILLCGKYSLSYPRESLPSTTEAKAMREYLLSLGIPQEKIYLEEDSQDSISNAYYAKKNYFLFQKEKEVVVVTSKYHLPRITYIFKKIFGPEYNLEFIGIPSSFDKETEEKLVKRQKEVLEKTKKMLEEMQDGDHEFLKDKLFTANFYKEKKPAWVIEKITKGI